MRVQELNVGFDRERDLYVGACLTQEMQFFETVLLAGFASGLFAKGFTPKQGEPHASAVPLFSGKIFIRVHRKILRRVVFADPEDFIFVLSGISIPGNIFGVFP